MIRRGQVLGPHSNFVCEAKAGDRWRGMTLIEALGTYRLAPKRCLNCLGPVSVHGGHGGQVPANVHRKGRTGCPQMPRRFSGPLSGTRRRRPEVFLSSQSMVEARAVDDAIVAFGLAAGRRRLRQQLSQADPRPLGYSSI